MRRFCALLCALIGLLGGHCAAAPVVTPSLTVILLPGTSLTDWQTANAPHLHQAMAQGAIAVMNTRSARTPSDRLRETPESACLTLSSGARAAADARAEHFGPPGNIVPTTEVSLSALYQRRMGITPPKDAWVNADWPDILRANQGLSYDVRPGNLGDALAAGGISLRAGGGADARIVACRSSGTVLPIATLSIAPNSCIVWDAGSDLPAADTLIARAMRQSATAQGRLLILSPYASDTAYAQGKRLTPIVLWGAGVPAGTLYSLSTHRAGLVVSTDFAPTVAGYFRATLPSPNFIKPWQVRPNTHAVRHVTTLETQAYAQASAMRILPVMVVILAVYIAFATLYAMKVQPSAALALFPIAWIAAALVSTTAREFVIGLIVETLALVGLSRWTGAAKLTFALTLLIVFVLMADMLTGDSLMERALLGYSFVEGARYYGIGNEAMGVLVGTALAVGAKIGRTWQGRIVTGLMLGAIAVLIVSPLAGAKAGGALVAVPAFSVLLWRQTGRTLTVKSGGLLALLTGLVLAGIVILDLRHGGQTHVALAITRIQHGGITEASDIILRKLAVEWHLLYHSTWAVLLWVEVGTLAFMKKAALTITGSADLYASGLTALVTCLLFNDAGVVAASLCAVILWSVLTATREKPPLRSQVQSEG